MKISHRDKASSASRMQYRSIVGRMMPRRLLVMPLVVALVVACVQTLPDTAPQFPETATVMDVSYTVGTAIETLTLPSATGGDGGLGYLLRPGVPGLTFNMFTRMLSGTPTTPGVHAMTYTVMDADNNLTDSDADSLGFTITVNPAARMSSGG